MVLSVTLCTGLYIRLADFGAIRPTLRVRADDRVPPLLPGVLDRSGGFNVSCRLYIRTGNEGGVSNGGLARRDVPLPFANPRRKICHLDSGVLSTDGVMYWVAKDARNVVSFDQREGAYHGQAEGTCAPARDELSSPSPGPPVAPALPGKRATSHPASPHRRPGAPETLGERCPEALSHLARLAASMALCPSRLREPPRSHAPGQCHRSRPPSGPLHHHTCRGAFAPMHAPSGLHWSARHHVRPPASSRYTAASPAWSGCFDGSRSPFGHKCGSRLNGQGILVHETKNIHINSVNSWRGAWLGRHE
jgi:hypothetical protein